MKMYLYSILLMLCVPMAIFAQQSPITVTSTTNGYSIEFNLPEYTVRDTTLMELFTTTEVFKYIHIDEKFGTTENIGYPQLPQLTFDLPVAYRASNFQVNVSNVVTQEIVLNKRILPVQNDLNELGETNLISLNAAYYASDGSIFNYNHQLSIPYKVFGTKGIGMSVFPFIYNPQTGKLTVLKQATFQLTYQLNGQAAPPASAYNSEVKQIYLSDFFDQINSNSGMNSMMSPSAVTTLLKGRYLMITAPSLLSTLTPFANYKRNLGFEVNVATTDAVGNTAENIKSYIKEQYDNLETRPDFVLLAGSHALIPAAMGNTSGTDMGNPITDFPYACMDGDDDYYADLIIGRFPVSSTIELERVLKKTTFMEMNMHRFEKKAKLWAGYEPRWIRRGIVHASFANAHEHASNTLTAEGYSCEILSQPSLSQVQSALIANPMFFIFFGHGNFDNMDGNSYQSITAGLHSVFPFVFSISCRTGNFGLGSDNIGVKWLVNDDNKGGVTFFGATTSTYQNANKNIEKKIFDKAFKENDQIGKITTIGMKNFKNRFWATLNPWRTKLHMKRYNLLGDPSLKINGEKVLTVPFVNYQPVTVQLKNPTNIPVTWSVAGNFTLSSKTNTSVIITRTGNNGGTVTAQFAGLGAVTEDLSSVDFSISGPSTICDQATYTIANLPHGATVQWSSVNNNLTLLPVMADSVVAQIRAYNATDTIVATIIFNNATLLTSSMPVTTCSFNIHAENDYSVSCRSHRFTAPFVVPGTTLTWQYAAPIVVKKQQDNYIDITVNGTAATNLWLRATIADNASGNIIATQTIDLPNHNIKGMTMTTLGRWTENINGVSRVRYGFHIETDPPGISLNDVCFMWTNIDIVENPPISSPGTAPRPKRSAYIETAGYKNDRVSVFCTQEDIGDAPPLDYLFPETLSELSTFPPPIEPPIDDPLVPDVPTNMVNYARVTLPAGNYQGELTGSVITLCGGFSVTETIYSGTSTSAYVIVTNPVTTSLVLERKKEVDLANTISQKTNEAVNVILYSSTMPVRSMQAKLSDQTIQINMEGLQSGLYTLIITKNGELIQSQIIIKK